MIINHNITALNTHRQLSNANNAQANSMEKLSSGLRINGAKDDAAGLSISEKMRGQIRGLEQASANAQDGISLMQTAEGALNETHDILQRMRELAVQSANDTNTGTDRAELQKEVDELAKEITRIANDTEFNTKTLLDGQGGNGLTFQIGANENQTMTLSIGAMDAFSLGVSATTATATENAAATATTAGADGTLGTADDVAGAAATTTGGLDISTDAATATAAITTINDAIEKVSSERSKLGANQNRLEHTINNLGTSAQNLTAAESRIRDVDMAKEMMEQTRNSILSQASQAMLAQSNQIPQAVLQLLR
ncbi:flagellin [Planomicrobium sp. Y74]|uniref:flagellin N-terminal helical domain-containing protein n=1 Tax=Planomicrobium sp. Y74 TaxID=2478977 RepID=UPI000EF51A07|nr:flagellin [Planomicrobium sp. Y74]RLQ91019.1 flagellin [Planomicrobium sp. Y74]